MSKISNRSKNKELKSVGDHQQFLSRIKKTLYYGKLPVTDRFSLPVTELASELFSEPRTGRSLERLHCKDAATISRQACISPCSLVLAILYLERLKACNPDYLQCVVPSELFLVSLMVSSKFLHDYGEEDEVFMDEWASTGGISVKELILLEKEFLNAIEWEIFVSEPTFWSKLRAIEYIIARKEGANRGYFTYTELENLLSGIDATNLINCISAIVAILITTYTAGILTLVGAVFIASHIPGSYLQNAQTTVNLKMNTPITPVTNAINLETVNLETDLDEKISSLLSNNLVNDTFERTNDEITTNLILNEETSQKMNLNAVNVLHTSIILASIQSHSNSPPNLTSNNCQSNNNVNYVNWDWWTNSTMQWLTDTSKLVETWNFLPNLLPKRYLHDRYTEMSHVTAKQLQLQAHVHKDTKVRIQDQLEQTWHMEWSDTVQNMLTDIGVYYQPRTLSRSLQEIEL